MKLFYLILFFSILNSVIPQELIITEYEERSGLPYLTTYDIAQTPDKFIWISTPTGIYKYDGSNWILQTENLDLRFNGYFKLFIDSKNYLWALPIVTTGELIYFDGEKWNKLVSPKLDYISNDFGVIYKNNNFEILVSTRENKLLHYNSGRWNEIALPESTSEITSNICVSENGFLIGFNNGVYKYSNSALLLQKELSEAVYANPVKHISILKNKFGADEIWMLSTNWIGKYSSDKFHLISDQINLPEISNVVSTFITPDMQGNIFFGNNNGVYRYNEKSKRILSINLSDETLSKGGNNLIVDHEKNIWITNFREIKKFRISPFINYNIEDGLPTNEVSSVALLKDNTIMLGQNGSLSFLDETINETIRFSRDETAPDISTRVMDYDYDSEGSLWIAVAGKGIAKIVNRDVEWKYFEDERYVQSIAIDTNDNVFVGTDIGLAKYEDGKLHEIDLGKNYLIRMTKALPDNSIAACTTIDGLFIINGDSIKNYKSKNEDGNNLYNFCYSKKYGMLAAAKDGVYKVENDSLVRFPLKYNGDRLPVYSINVQNDSIIWIGTHNGLVKYDGKNKRYYNSFNGLAGNEANRSGFAIDNTGAVWFGTDKGASKYIEEFDYNEEVMPIVFISSIESSGGIITKDFDDLIFQDDDVIIVNYRCLSFIDEENNKYILDLYDFEGSLVNSDTTYSNSSKFIALSPGEYRLEIFGVNSLHLKSAKPAVVKLIISFPFYLTWWFISLLIVFLLFSVYFVQWYYSQKKYTELLKQEVARQTKDIKESENRFHVLTETAFEGIAILDDLKIIYVTKQLSEMLNYKSEELLNASITKILAEKDIEFIQHEVSSKNKLETSAIKKGNISFEVELRIRDILFNNKTAKAIVFRDISEIKTIQRSLIEEKNKAERSEQLKTEFLAQMSHEIRSPMNTVLNFVSLLKDEIKNKDYQDYFESMKIAGRRIVRTINLILDMSQIQTGTYEPIFKEFNILERVIEHLYREYKLTAESKGLKLKLFNNSDNNIVHGDQYTVEQIIQNLLDNAIKYTLKGEIGIHLERNENNRLEIKISDTGIGIAEEYIPTLFNPFTQEEQGYTRTFEGNGLGLALVKNYCELNKAEISVASKKNSGTIFTIIF